MGKFYMECPGCKRYVEASKGFFAKKKIECVCGYTINVKTDKMISKECGKCGNIFIHDQSKGDAEKCPVCNLDFKEWNKNRSLVNIMCPSCSCKVFVDKSKIWHGTYPCPLCSTYINVENQLEKEKVKKQGLASVIKYEGANDVFIWKHPIEDFNLGSQLIVHESQEAIFFKDGKALDLFGAGRYTLATQNLPMLESLYKLPTNADDIFHSEVYFINLTTQMGIKWGTDSRVSMMDPASGVPVELGASGNFSLRVDDSRKLLLKLVGTMKGITEDGLVARFKPMIINKVKANLAKAIESNNISVLEMDAHIDTISDWLRDAINKNLTEYGIAMPEFFITTISPAEGAINTIKKQIAEKVLRVRQEEIKKAEAEAAQSRKILEAQTEAQLKMVAAQGEAEAQKIKAQAEAEAYKMQAYAEAEEMHMKGYTYRDETSRQIGLEAMKNGIIGNGEGGSGVIGDMAGVAITLGTMGSVVNMTKNVLDPIVNSTHVLGAGLGDMATNGTNPEIIASKEEMWDCISCGLKQLTTKHCPECGSKRSEVEKKEVWDCVNCGLKAIKSRFCPECGSRKLENVTWDCKCGEKGIKSKFCPECGTKKGE